MNVDKTLKVIKQSFRLYMNGVTAQSLREKGVAGMLAWGVSIQHLREMAADYTPDLHLALALWKQNIRECKLLAAMLMPAEEMPEEVCDIWIAECPTQEIAEQLAFILLQHLPYAPQMAFRWIASTEEFPQVAGYTILGRLFLEKREPDFRGVNELLDQAAAALAEGSLSVRHAATNCLLRLGDLSDDHQALVDRVLS